MEKNKKNRRRLLMFGALSCCFIFLMAGATSSFDKGQFWSLLNGDTIVLNDSAWNVALGVNKTTPYKLEVEGETLLHRVVINGTSTIDFGLFGSIYRDSSTLYFISGEKMYLNGYKKLILKSDRPVGKGGINISTDGNIDIVSQSGGYINFSGGKIGSNGSINSQSSISTNTYFDGWGTIPIACPIAWCGDMYGLSIPINFVVCNGSTITDIDSILYGYESPNLTSRFIMGFTSSNITGGNNSHSHTYSGTTSFFSGTNTGQGALSAVVRTIGHSHTYSGTSANSNGLPPYYTMVYIMRIK